MSPQLLIPEAQRDGLQLPGPGKPSPLLWKWVPLPIQQTLQTAGCYLIRQWARQPHDMHVRFQYAPLVYEGDLFYLQRWALVEWAVSPSQVIFPRKQWPLYPKTLSNGSELSQAVRQTVAGIFQS